MKKLLRINDRSIKNDKRGVKYDKGGVKYDKRGVGPPLLSTKHSVPINYGVIIPL